MPEIAHIANLWSLVGHPSPAREWSLDRKIKACADAGFDGITTLLTPEHRRLAEKHGLPHLLGFISSSDPAEFARCIREQKEGGAVHINVQLDNHDTPPAIATRHWIQMLRDAEKIGGVVLSLEVHRDTCTETPEKTYEIELHKNCFLGWNRIAPSGCLWPYPGDARDNPGDRKHSYPFSAAFHFAAAGFLPNRYVSGKPNPSPPTESDTFTQTANRHLHPHPVGFRYFVGADRQRGGSRPGLFSGWEEFRCIKPAGSFGLRCQ